LRDFNFDLLIQNGTYSQLAEVKEHAVESEDMPTVAYFMLCMVVAVKIHFLLLASAL